MRRYVALFLVVAGFALIGHSWLSGVLSVPAKIALSVAGLTLVAAAVLLQWTNRTIDGT